MFSVKAWLSLALLDFFALGILKEERKSSAEMLFW